jgi:hypothetical protein
MRYTKLLIIVWYKVGSEKKSKLLEEEYFALTSIGVSIILLSVSLAHSRISATFLNEKEDHLWVSGLPQYPRNIIKNQNLLFQTSS